MPHHRAELQQQIEAAAAAKRAAREAELAADHRAAATHSPFGRGGCGAPLRGASGQVITNLNEVSSDTSSSAGT